MALVVIWVTNKQKYRKFVLEELFPSWSCKPVGEWHWIKVTRKGEMVFDLDSTHKKPYEPLLIGQFDDRIKACEHNTIKKSRRENFDNGINEMTVYTWREKNNENKTEISLENNDEVKIEEKQDVPERTLPQHQLICSVPCSLHSRKPPLNDIFRKYLPVDAKCIELFARNLLPSWTSWGNEVLKYQHFNYFQSKKR